MTDFNLKGMQASAVFQLEKSKQLIQLKGDWRQFRNDVRNVCDYFLMLATASLLVDVKPKMFLTNLGRCVENWTRFLDSSQKHFGKQPLLIYNKPLFASIILADTPAFVRLKAVLPKAPAKKEEYVDTFHLI